MTNYGLFAYILLDTGMSNKAPLKARVYYTKFIKQATNLIKINNTKMVITMFY